MISENINLKELKKYEPIYVIGHSHIDVDSAVSSKIFSEILNYNGIEAYYAILNEQYDFDEFNKKMIDDCMDFNPIVINVNDINKYNFFLIDHNDVNQSVGKNAHVIGSLDHHPYAGNVKNVYLSEICSISLCVYHLFKNDYPFTYEQKYQIFMAFLSDSSFGMSSRFKESDKVLIDELGFKNDYYELFKKYFIPTNLSNGLESVLYNGNKKYQFGNINFQSGYIETYGTDKLLDYKHLINKQKSFLGIWWDYQHEKTYAYFKYNNKLIEYKYDFIASRSKTILNDVLNDLKK